MCITNPLKISDFQGNLLHMLLFLQKHAFYFSILRIKEGLSHVQQPLVMRRKKLCGESFRTDVTSRLFTRNLSIIFYKVFKNAFKSGSSFQSGMAGVFILVSIVSNALRRASGLAFA